MGRGPGWYVHKSTLGEHSYSHDTIQNLKRTLGREESAGDVQGSNTCVAVELWLTVCEMNPSQPCGTLSLKRDMCEYSHV